MLRRFLILIFAACFIQTGAAQVATQPTSASPGLDQLKFLIGNWIGEGSADTGQAGSGSCSFELKLQDHAIVRNNHSEYPATKDHAAITHDDLMIIYPDRALHALRAFYTDNEGHVINYTVIPGSNLTSAVFLGDPVDGQPRYRLSYATTDPSHMTITFEMARPDRPDQFEKFIAGKLKKLE